MTKDGMVQQSAGSLIPDRYPELKLVDEIVVASYFYFHVSVLAVEAVLQEKKPNYGDHVGQQRFIAWLDTQDNRKPIGSCDR